MIDYSELDPEERLALARGQEVEKVFIQEVMELLSKEPPVLRTVAQALWDAGYRRVR